MPRYFCKKFPVYDEIQYTGDNKEEINKWCHSHKGFAVVDFWGYFTVWEKSRHVCNLVIGDHLVSNNLQDVYTVERYDDVHFNQLFELIT